MKSWFISTTKTVTESRKNGGTSSQARPVRQEDFIVRLVEI